MYNNDFKMDGVKHTEFLTAAQQHSEFLTAQQHTLLSGMASYDGGRYFLFSPDEPVAGLSKYKRAGELLQAYLELQAENAEPELVRAIKAFVEGHELANKWQLVELCNKILA